MTKNDKLVKSATRTKKIPAKLPTWICKAIWDATSVKLKVQARDEASAWETAWKRVSRTEGGDSCYKVVVLGKEVKYGI